MLSLFAHLGGFGSRGFAQFLNLGRRFVAQSRGFLFSLNPGFYVILFGLGALQFGFAVSSGAQVVDLSVHFGAQRGRFTFRRGYQFISAVLRVSEHGFRFGFRLGGAFLSFAASLSQHGSRFGFGALSQALRVRTGLFQ